MIPDNPVARVFFLIWIASIIGCIVLSGVRSYRRHGNLNDEGFGMSLIPPYWVIAPFALVGLISELTGFTAYLKNREAITAWDRYEKRALEVKLIPDLDYEIQDMYSGRMRMHHHACRPRVRDPRENPGPAELPSVHRVRVLLAQTTKRDFIDIPKSEAERIISVYRKGERDTRIAELEQELKELA
jgi:hypothetical protein